MTAGTELNCGQNEITQLLSSEAETEQVELPLKADGRCKLIKQTSLIQSLIDSPILKDLFRHRPRRRKRMKLSKLNPKVTWSHQSLTLLITVMVFFAGGAYMALFSFHEAFPISAPLKSVNLSIRELLTFPKAAADDFLVITTVTTTFILSMGIITIAVCWKFVWGVFLTILSLFTIAASSLGFFAMLNKLIPHHITIAGGNLKVPATLIVIFYDIYVIILGCAFASTVQWCWSSRRRQDADLESQ